MKKLLIYDDEKTFQGNLRDRLSFLDTTIFDIRTPNQEKFLKWMEILENRRRTFRESGTWGGESILLDEASIFVVDYDLFNTISFLTAEDVAYLARCFSKCGLIVGVNQHGHNPFDLTLRGHPESFADLNIGQEQLGNRNLWGEHEGGFHPWHWPALPRYQRDFERRVRDVRENLEIPIWQVLGFPLEQFKVLPRSIVQFFGGAKLPDEVTFRDFVIESGNGLQSKDAECKDQIDDNVVSRIGAARIAKWLERLVLPNQTILMDAPHLVSQYPSLLDGDTTNIDAWNATARRTSCDELGLRINIIEQFRFEKEYWLSRPAWFWDGVRKYEEILEVREPWEIESPSWVFCEDASQFYEGKYQGFVADTEPPFSRRFVRDFDYVKYGPVVQFFM